MMKKLILLGLVFLFIGCPPTEKNSVKIYLQRQDYVHAKEQALLGLKDYPDDYELYCLLAKAEIGLANSIAAGKAFQDAIKIDSTKTFDWMLSDKYNVSVYWQAFYNAAFSSSKEEKLQEALANLKYAKILNPNDVSQYILEGATYAKMGNTDAANGSYNKAIGIDPENPEAYYLIGKAVFEKQLYDSSLAYFYNANKHFENKVMKIEKIIFQNVPEPTKELRQETINLWAEKKNDELDQLIKVKLGLDGGFSAHGRNIEAFSKTTDGLAQSYYWLGMAYYKLGKNDQALKNFSKTLELMPSDLNALFFTGEVLIKSEKYSEAVGYFDKVVQLKPDDRDAWWYLGALSLRMKDYKKAVDIYENNVLRLDPKFIEALQNLASAYQALGNTKKATEIMAKIDQIKKEQ